MGEAVRYLLVRSFSILLLIYFGPRGFNDKVASMRRSQTTAVLQVRGTEPSAAKKRYSAREVPCKLAGRARGGIHDVGSHSFGLRFGGATADCFAAAAACSLVDRGSVDGSAPGERSLRVEGERGP